MAKGVCQGTQLISNMHLPTSQSVLWRLGQVPPNIKSQFIVCLSLFSFNSSNFLLKVRYCGRDRKGKEIRPIKLLILLSLQQAFLKNYFKGLELPTSRKWLTALLYSYLVRIRVLEAPNIQNSDLEVIFGLEEILIGKTIAHPSCCTF